MSKIQISPNPSGAGIVTLAAPNTASDVTLTLPAVTAELITNSSGVLNIGSGQIYKDASGNVGLGTVAPAQLIDGTATNPRLKLTATSTGYALSQFGNSSGTSFFGRDSATASFFGVANATCIYTSSADPIVFFTSNGTERMRIEGSSGNLLVGTTTGDARVSIVSSSTNDNVGSLSVKNTNAAADACVASFTTATNSTATSNVLIKFVLNGGASGTGQINANGASQAAFGGFSDRRLKENIVDLPSQLESIMALRPVEFNYIESEGGGHQIGFIAQEMQEVYADAVGERSDGMLTVTGWNKTEARLVKAIQELTARLEVLENK